MADSEALDDKTARMEQIAVLLKGFVDACLEGFLPTMAEGFGLIGEAKDYIQRCQATKRQG